MSTFEDLQSFWANQPAAQPNQTAAEIMDRAEKNRQKMIDIHRGTVWILSLTVLILAGFFYQYVGLRQPTATAGMSLMIAPLLIRIGFEVFSYRRFVSIDPITNLRTCLQQTTDFHRLRQRIQWLATPLSMGCYVVGFLLLLPYFKAGLSTYFYWYIIGSGLLFLVIISAIIVRQINEEARLLRHLKQSYEALEEKS
jgi:uncharacterized membrane protein (DUF485 family)